MRRMLSWNSRKLLLWRTAQITGLGVTIVLIVGFFVRPELSLDIFWNVLIPVLPATFLIVPSFWRGVCPLATLNMMTNGLFRRRNISSVALSRAGSLGIALLFLLVPARRFLFNEHSVPLAIIVIAIALTALVFGAVFNHKAGFCNAFCPVLPVEKLYGQQPFFELRNPRCPECALCTAKGCFDLVPTKSAMRAVGAKKQSGAWLTTSYGIFASAFPGFVVGYFMTEDGTLSDAGSIYLTILLYAVASYAMVSVLVILLNIRIERVFPVLAASALGLYYWFVAPVIVDTLGVSPSVSVFIRSATLLLVCIWLLRALLRANQPLLGHLSSGSPVSSSISNSRLYFARRSD